MRKIIKALAAVEMRQWIAVLAITNIVFSLGCILYILYNMLSRMGVIQW